MAFLSLAGSPVPCVEDSWSEETPETLGEEVRMIGGNLGSTERTPKRVFRGDVAFDNAAAVDAFRVSISVSGSPGVPKDVTATGDSDGITRGSTITVRARMGRIQALRHRVSMALPVTRKWRFTLTLTESA